MKKKTILKILLFIVMDFSIAQTYLPLAGGTLTDNLKINGTDAAWAENLVLIKPSGWGGVRLSRRDPLTWNFDGNWAIGYNANTGNDFSVSSNYQGTQYDYLLHISAANRNVGIGNYSPLVKLSVDAPQGEAATSGTHQNGILRLQTAQSIGWGEVLDFGMHIGTSGPPSYAWVQATNKDGLFATYNFSINPNGGNVGIGTANPLASLHVIGNSRNTIKLEANNIWANNTDASSVDFQITQPNSQSARLASIQSTAVSGWGGDLSFYTKDANGNADQNIVERLRIAYTGNIGIGTTNPNNKLDVKGNQTLRGSGSNSGVRDIAGISYGTETYSAPFNAIQFRVEGGTGLDDNLAILFKTQSNGVSGERMRITDYGCLLIGKTSQVNGNYKLDVAGNIRANKLVVNTTGADYVFNDGYYLRPLLQVESYINQNKHLPGMEPAKKMQEEGVSVGGIQTKLLEKIEELTLYIIEMKKENVKAKMQFQKENELLKQRIKKLETNK